MALGGGTFLNQNKVLPGSYINFISTMKASATLSDRGVATLPLELDWGKECDVFTVTAEDVQKHSIKIFGYAYADEKLKGIRDLFKNIKIAHLYRLNRGEKAANDYATAKYSGIRGNDLSIVIQANEDAPGNFDVKTILGTTLVDIQTVSKAMELVSNDYVVFKSEVQLEFTTGMPLAGGSNGNDVVGADYQGYLEKIESYSFNAMGCLSTTPEITDLFVQFTKRLRDDIGAKFQTVVYRASGNHEGIINLKNKVMDEGVNEASLVYWVTGIIAGCAVNKSNTNKLYDGAYEVDINYTQAELKSSILAGEFTLHKVGDDVRVLEDINSFITVTDKKNSDFSSNQTIRVLDQIANDIGTLFNTKYLGNIPNDQDGRISLWNDIVTHHQQLQGIRAIENFKSEDVKVEIGASKKAVVISDIVTPVNAMAKLYMTVVVE